MLDTLCERCGKNMTDESGMTCIAVQVRVSVSIGAGSLTEDFYREQLGKYELDHVYNFCWECYLDSLMGIKEN